MSPQSKYLTHLRAETISSTHCLPWYLELKQPNWGVRKNGVFEEILT